MNNQKFFARLVVASIKRAGGGDASARREAQSTSGALHSGACGSARDMAQTMNVGRRQTAVWRALSWLGYGVIGVVAVPIIAVGAFVVWLAARLPEPPADPTCFSSPSVVVRLGDHLLALPRRDWNECQRLGDAPLEEDRIVFSTMGRTFPNENEDPGFRATVELRMTMRSTERTRHTYKGLQHYLTEEGLAVADLPAEGDFFVFSSARSGQWFIAKPGTIETPQGEPWTAQCERAIANAALPDSVGHGCYVGYAWSDSADIQYWFYDGVHPRERWGKLDSAIRAYLRQLELAASGHQQ